MDPSEKLFRQLSVQLTVDILNAMIDGADETNSSGLKIVKGVMIKLAEDLGIRVEEKSEEVRQDLEKDLDAQERELDAQENRHNN